MGFPNMDLCIGIVLAWDKDLYAIMSENRDFKHIASINVKTCFTYTQVSSDKL